MSDFIRWLYANYIKPQLDAESSRGYEQALSLMDTSLDPGLHASYEQVLEFYAANAFLLGLRTGAGLKEACKG